MSGVRTVYAIEHGMYSDRRTDCLFETRALAEAYVDALRKVADDLAKREEYVYPEPSDIEIVEYDLWSVVPVATVDQWGDLEVTPRRIEIVDDLWSVVPVEEAVLEVAPRRRDYE